MITSNITSDLVGNITSDVIKSFNPSDISNFLFELEAIDSNSLGNPIGNDKISQWDSLAGNGYKATQVSIPNQPVYKSLYPSVKFDENNLERMSVDSFSLSQSNTITAVVRLASSVAGFIFHSGASVPSMILEQSGSTIVGRSFDGAVSTIVTSGVLNFDESYVITYIWNNASNESQLFVNGVLVDSGLATNAITVANEPKMIGSHISAFITNTAFNGHIQALLAYGKALLSQERNNLENYLTKIYLTPIFNPSDISNLKLQLLSTDAASLGNPANLDSLSQWDDISGESNNFSQGSISNQPIYRAVGSNGKPAVFFNGSEFFSSSFNATFANEGTFFVVGTATVNDAIFRQFLGQWGAPNREFTLGKDGSNFYYSANTGDDALSNISSFNNPAVLTLLHDPLLTNPLALYVNSVLEGDGVPAFEPHALNLDIGALSGIPSWIGEIQAIIFYDRALSAQERALVENYLTTIFNT